MAHITWKYSWLIAIATLAFGGADAAAQEAGRIAGRVVSTQTGEGLPSIRVAVQGSDAGAVSDAAGRYTLSDVPAGPQTVTASGIGYAAKAVTGVSVAAGRTTDLDISMAPEALALEGLVVTAERERGSTSALLADRRNSAVVVDAIGSEQISRTPDGDAAAAVKRVPGVTVVDGKFVYVRGLGERYSGTTLNGAPLPSPLPDRKAVPLDLIPTSLLESIVTAKTYSPDQPGDYAGGLVQIETKSVPTSRTLRLSTGFGINTQSSLRAGLRDGTGTGFFGFSDGNRDLPVTRNQPLTLPDDPQARERFAGGFTRSFAPVSEDLPLNQSYGVAYGDELDIAGRPVGVVSTLSFSRSTAVPENQGERYFVPGAGGIPTAELDLTGEQGEEEVSIGALLSTSVEVAPAQRLTLTGTYTRLTEDQAREFSGDARNAGGFVETFQTRYIANTIANLQLAGEHLIAPLGDLTADWRVAYGRATRDEPGTRYAAYRGTGPGEPTFFFPNAASGLILSQGLEEDLGSGALNLKLPFTFRSLPATLKFGVSGDLRDRTVATRRILLDPAFGLPDSVAALPPEQLFVPGRVGSGFGMFRLDDRTFPEDNYLGEQKIGAGYALADVELLPRLRAVVGARVEWATQDLTAFDPRVGRATAAARLDDVDVLPALNLTYALNDAMNLRAAVSRTVARPLFRELAPFLYTDYFGGVPVRGNPFLQRSQVSNADLRWEWFFGSGSVLSVGGFYKYFDDPIEPVFLLLGTNPARTFANTQAAHLYGGELEFSTPLATLASALEGFSVNANLTLADSRVEGDSVFIFSPSQPGTPLRFASSATDGRPLFGQSPYVINLGLTYASSTGGTTATLLFNRFGRRLDALGGTPVPDIYEEGRSQLDFTVEQALRAGLSLKLSAARLLGSDVEFSQSFPSGDEVVTRQYDLGSTFSASLSWEP
ncbi:MAG: TonB-dependent receptor domain-containing protein [Longimicrobiaceae bacterium]